MSIKSLYVPGKIPNVLRNLDDDFASQIVCLAIASNDLVVNVEALGKFPDEENGYFFYNSIGILREIAKKIDDISKNAAQKKMTEETINSIKKLKGALSSFDDGSLTKSTLKPIRDAHFHYRYPCSEIVSDLIERLKGEDYLQVGVRNDSDRLGSIHYKFGEWFRANFINSYLTDKLSKELASVSVEIVTLVDTLLSSLSETANEDN